MYKGNVVSGRIISIPRSVKFRHKIKNISDGRRQEEKFDSI
jgi:hypothetical protein